ncbi:MAG: hypothetical protein JWL81_588 [Verrucomicrobiales bacterium]|nr:hypothetical protein [Verrucomicrobiales bacterium]
MDGDLFMDFSQGIPARARARTRLAPWKMAVLGTTAVVAIVWFVNRLTHGIGSDSSNAKSVSASGSSNAAAGKPGSGQPAKEDSTTGNSQSGTTPFTSSPNYPAALSIAGMEENNTRAEALEALMETWVAADPVQAGNWAGSLPAGTFRDDALSSLMFHWSGKDPAAAAAWMSRTGVDDPEAVSVLSSRWAAQSPAAAAAWASTLSNLESRRGALSSIAGAWAATDPVSAAAWAASLSGEERTAAIVTSITAWAALSPASASQWLSSITFSSENDRAAAAAALVTAWTAQSPAAVSKFINSLPEGPAREAAASQFAVTAAPNAPAEALMWAMNLTDPEQRNQVVADACESWLYGSPESFKAGIAEAMTLMEDPAMRRGVFEMLYERDPAFQTNLIKMVDDATTPKPPDSSTVPAPAPAQTPAPAASEATLNPPAAPVPTPAAPDPGTDAGLLPPFPLPTSDSTEPADSNAPAEPGPDDINL